jgi:hypothetical protein
LVKEEGVDIIRHMAVVAEVVSMVMVLKEVVVLLLHMVELI